jgi:hypothetical protein
MYTFPSKLAPQGPDPGYSRAAPGKAAVFALVAFEGVELGLERIEAHNNLIGHPEQYLM